MITIIIKTHNKTKMVRKYLKIGNQNYRLAKLILKGDVEDYKKHIMSNTYHFKPVGRQWGLYVTTETNAGLCYSKKDRIRRHF